MSPPSPKSEQTTFEQQRVGVPGKCPPLATGEKINRWAFSGMGPQSNDLLARVASVYWGPVLCCDMQTGPGKWMSCRQPVQAGAHYLGPSTIRWLMFAQIEYFLIYLLSLSLSITSWSRGPRSHLRVRRECVCLISMINGRVHFCLCMNLSAKWTWHESALALLNPFEPVNGPNFNKPIYNLSTLEPSRLSTLCGCIRNRNTPTHLPLPSRPYNFIC